MRSKILLIGYGNPGRLDDGLGPACARRLSALDLPGVTIDANYQLNVEDATAVAEHDIVIFADAAVGGKEPFGLYELRPAREWSFTTHSVEPATVLAMAHEMFSSSTRGYALGIRGYEFNEFGERISPPAQANLEAAVAFLAQAIRADALAAAA